MRFGTWNVRSLCRAGSLTAAARELATYKLDLLGVQEVRWNKGDTVRAGDCNFFCGKGNGVFRIMLNIGCFCDDAVHASGFGRGDCSVLVPDMVFHIEAVPFHY